EQFVADLAPGRAVGRGRGARSPRASAGAEVVGRTTLAHSDIAQKLGNYFAPARRPGGGPWAPAGGAELESDRPAHCRRLRACGCQALLKPSGPGLETVAATLAIY